ncbi:zinc ribbon domain-containing protein [Jeotgalibacillus haloalkalitolerans]|nr:zinc ribbon domain-containing protein [Jeotgalibacillus sp. HH7-29]
MNCVNCGHEQSTGKFCGNCGTEIIKEGFTAQSQHAASAPPPLQEQVQQQHQAAAVSSTPNPTIEKAKATSISYWNYFKQYIKSPSKSLQTGEGEFKNGLISIILFSILFGSMPYLMYQATFGGFGGYGPSFFGVFFQSLMFTAAIVFLVITCLFLSNKLFGRQDSYKSVTAIFGAHILLPIIFLAAAVLTTLMSMYTLSVILIVLSVSIVIGSVPLHIISSLMTMKSKTADPLYGFLAYIVLVSIVFAVFSLSIAESSFWDLMSMGLF